MQVNSEKTIKILKCGLTFSHPSPPLARTYTTFAQRVSRGKIPAMVKYTWHFS
jgi:hypothetical protein